MPSVVLANGCSMGSREFIDRYVFAPPWPTSVNIAPRAAGNMLRRVACGPAVVCAACAAVVAVGCGTSVRSTAPRVDSPTAAESPPALPSFADQLKAVCAGAGHCIRVADRPLEAAEWEALRGLDGLRELVLDRGRADDSHAALLGSLSRLERLVLRHSPLGNEGFRAIGQLAGLRDLNVPQAGCTAEGLRSLSGLAALRSLRMGGLGLHGSEAGEAMEGVVRLRSLHLIDVDIGDDGLAAIGRLPGLWNLYLDGAGVSDTAWAEYFHRHPDVHVHVDQSHHDRDPRGAH